MAKILFHQIDVPPVIVENYSKMNRTLIGKWKINMIFKYNPFQLWYQIKDIFATLKWLNLITTGRGCYRSLRSLVDQPAISSPNILMGNRK